MLLQDTQGRSPHLSKNRKTHLLRGNTKGTSNQYPNATRVSIHSQRLTEYEIVVWDIFYFIEPF